MNEGLGMPEKWNPNDKDLMRSAMAATELT
jgi:hypothetical protein